MSRRQYPDIAKFSATYHYDLTKRMQGLTRSFFWMLRRANQIVNTRNVPVTGLTVAAYNRLHGETSLDFGAVALRSIRRYCLVDAAQRTGMRLLIDGKDGKSHTYQSVSGATLAHLENIPVSTPENSVLAQLNQQLWTGLHEEAGDLELAAWAAELDVVEGGTIDRRLVEMTARAEAAVQKTTDETDQTDNEAINRAIQIYYMLHVFEQLADLNMMGPDNMYVPLQMMERD